jgi:hypothetical protein
MKEIEVGRQQTDASLMREMLSAGWGRRRHKSICAQTMEIKVNSPGASLRASSLWNSYIFSTISILFLYAVCPPCCLR